ncbi:Rad17 cell cycle checkpoint protein [Necator americanus]|uniref:Rad17 cell cycle checkpoint protein n=1 Tax=Necator americanus TaxID=51031 RepID=W2TBG1_NECAM|nr:Rad17 cell cycle checkpoint protein [Necator americanus]ETN78536.1 Rad17 cell cycle checkpoint protein [Necator americanus]
MTSKGDQSAKKRKKTTIVDLESESDGDIVVVEEKRPSTQIRKPTRDSGDNAVPFYSQNFHPMFHTRSLERAVKKKEAWTKPKPEVHCLFFAGSAPRKTEDLAVNPRIVEKLKVQLSKRNDGNKLLLVTGPAGSGKSTSIEVVARSLNFEVLRWERDSELEIVTAGETSYIKEENEMNSFLRFLRKSTLPEKLRRHRRRTPVLGRLYHIQDLPTIAYKDPVQFRQDISSHLRESNDFIVFDLTSQDSSWTMSPKRIFTKSFIKSLGMSELEFCPIASTFIRKGLRRVVDCLGFHNRLSVQDYKAVEKLTNGDIRSAISIIQFSLLCSREKFAIPKVFEATSNDELFHMLGVLLYAKREKEGSNFSEIEMAVREDLRRPLPTRDINDVLDMSKASAATVMMFLHEHEPNFSGSISATRKVFDSMSLCDSMSSDWETRQISQDFVSQICARSTMFYNYKANSRDIPYISVIKSSLTGSQYRLASYLTRPWNFTWNIDRSLWDHQIASDPSYRIAQLRESVDDAFLSQPSQLHDDIDEETFTIEDSENGTDSDDSFEDPVTFN